MPNLLSARGERVTLEANRTYTVGRGTDCDIVLNDPLCSRHHARLTVGGERTRGLIVEDLGSRNGTFVNENRVTGPTTAKEGCTVRIGATLYTVCAADDDGWADAPDTGTVAIERLSLGVQVDTEMLSLLRGGGGAGRTDFAGKLDGFDLTDLLQMMIQHGRSGTLHLAYPGGKGSIEVRSGDVLDAVFGDTTGFEALVEMVRQGNGSFRFVATSRPCEDTIDHPSHILLVELCKALDERSA